MIQHPPRIAIAIRWHVAFTDLEPGRHWLSRLLARLRPGFRHVLAFRDTPAGLLIVQQTVARTQVDLNPWSDAATYAAEVRGRGATVLVIPAAPDDSVPVPRFLNCVGLTRSLLGLPGRPWQTPSGLFRQLAAWESAPSRASCGPKEGRR